MSGQIVTYCRCLLCVNYCSSLERVLCRLRRNSLFSATFIYATLKKTLNTLHYIILDIARNACFQKQK